MQAKGLFVIPVWCEDAVQLAGLHDKVMRYILSVYVKHVVTAFLIVPKYCVKDVYV